MFRLFLVVVLAVVAVQAQSRPGEVAEVGKVRSALDKLRKTADTVIGGHRKDETKASCANKFSFVPTTQAIVDKSQTCLTGIKSISDLVMKMDETRTKFVEALNAAATESHNAFDIKQLTAIARMYLRELHNLASKNKVAKADQSKYVNECVWPVIEDIWKNAAAAKKEVDACYMD